MKIFKEFKEFAVKGNMIDMAVGIIIGMAFGKIVSSLVNDVIMPPIGMLIGGVDFTDLKVLLKAAGTDEAGNAIEAVTLNYGTFIQTAIDFLIVALVVFMMVKAINSLKKKEEAAPAPPPAPTKEEQLLTEIRDLLKK
ncbi:MAG: large-conductance mechanosensitive channel protein MscL [Bacteroidales bacterium]|nr:large-conductance mechanosensitive channel protein MscL [Bacteroidales bacterium]